MECGADVYTCHGLEAWQRIVGLLLATPILASQAIRYIAQLSDEAKYALQVAITLGGYAFGVWRWYVYREKFLFDRLNDMLAREERRLRKARSELFASVLRPSINSATEAPRFARSALQMALRQWGWISRFALIWEIAFADRALGKATTVLHAQRDARKRSQDEVTECLMAAHLLRSAIDSTRADQVKDEGHRRALVEQVLRHLDDALRLPSMSNDLDALELKSYQLMRVGELSDAEAIYEKIIEQARNLPRSKARDLRLLRAHKGLALIYRQQCKNGSVHSALTNAIEAIEDYSQLVGQDLLDQAHVLELHSAAGFALGYVQQAPTSKRDAKDAYSDLSMTKGPRSLLGRIAFRLRLMLRRESGDDVLYLAALSGLERVRALGPVTPPINPAPA